MATYMVLAPPNEAESAEKTRFIRDSFSWAAFLFPFLWALFQRLWIVAVIVAICHGGGILLVAKTDFWAAGLAVIFAVHLLMGFEGRHLAMLALTMRGWREKDMVLGERLIDAEEIYFAGFKQAERPLDHSWAADPSLAAPRHSRESTALGLFGYGDKN